jgi:hypothetical protein
LRINIKGNWVAGIAAFRKMLEYCISGFFCIVASIYV